MNASIRKASGRPAAWPAARVTAEAREGQNRIDPKTVQNHPKISYFDPKMVPKCPYIAPDRVKNGSKRVKKRSKVAKNGSKVI